MNISCKNLMLNGIRVLDFTNNLAGPGAAALLADHGADVIHIEKPVFGDDCRKFPPLVNGESLSHAGANRSKKSVVLNLKDPDAIQVIKRMIQDTDILIESGRPGVMARLGLDYGTVKVLRPDLIYCSISAFGQTGPYSDRPGYDIIAQAYSGMMYYTGEPGTGPTKSCTVIGDQIGALNAFANIVIALYHRAQTGQGQWIDISLARGLVWLNGSFDFKYVGKKREKTGNQDAQLSPYGIFEGKDNQSAVIGAVSMGTWSALCKVMGREDLIRHPKFADNACRTENQVEVKEIIEHWLKQFDNIDLPVQALQKAGVPCIKCYTMEDLEQDPHAIACGWIRDVPVPESIRRKIPHHTIAYGIADFSDAEIEVSAAHDLGQDNYEVLQAYGMSKEEIAVKETQWAKEVLGQ